MNARTFSRLSAFLLLLACAGVLAISPGARTAGAQPALSDEARTAQVLDSIRDQPPLLQAFLRAMPKGGDIHSHLVGAVYAETMIRLGAERGLCMQRQTFQAVPPPCDAASGRPPIADALRDMDLYNAIINAWSMRGFVPGPRTGHDHFFDTFDLYLPTLAGATGDELAEVASRAAAQNESYLELMETIDSGLPVSSFALSDRVGWNPDLLAMRQALLDAGMAEVVANSRAALDEAEARARMLMRCGTPAADAGCDVTVRWLYQVIRNGTPQAVFAQIVLGFELSRADPRFVGLNLVAPEDDLVSITDYSLHMRMLDTLWQMQPQMKIALHAGELTLGLVPPKELRFHIREAVEVGHARRIGHGVDVMYEDDPLGLLAELRRRDVLVEINLTSNALILGVSGRDHPLPIYLAAGVPLTLSTDDEGVSRIDLTFEYHLAVRSHGLSYAQVKTLVRNSITYSFLAGESLWELPNSTGRADACREDRPGDAPLSTRCERFLQGSEKARLQWEVERRFAEFERRISAGALGAL